MALRETSISGDLAPIANRRVRALPQGGTQESAINPNALLERMQPGIDNLTQGVTLQDARLVMEAASRKLRLPAEISSLGKGLNVLSIEKYNDLTGRHINKVQTEGTFLTDTATYGAESLRNGIKRQTIKFGEYVLVILESKIELVLAQDEKKKVTPARIATVK